MITQIQAVKRALRDQHGFRPTGGTDEDPCFTDIPAAYYPVVIAGHLSRVEIKVNGDLYLDEMWDETARCEQMSANIKFLMIQIDAIHAALCPWKIDTWQNRAIQARVAAEAIALAAERVPRLSSWGPLDLDGAARARDLGNYDHPVLSKMLEELSIEIAEQGIDTDHTEQEIEEYTERRLDEILSDRPFVEVPKIDPVCVIHGKKFSEHTCLYCCMCFKDLTPDTCNVTKEGIKEDVCVECARAEQMRMEIIMKRPKLPDGWRAVPDGEDPQVGDRVYHIRATGGAWDVDYEVKSVDPEILLQDSFYARVSNFGGQHARFTGKAL